MSELSNCDRRGGPFSGGGCRFARWLWPQLRRVPRREIEAIEIASQRHAVIRLRSGKRRVVWTSFVEPASRRAAVAALERVARAGSSPA
jgi:hypothetical protein